MLAPAIDTTFSEVLKLPEQSWRALVSSAQVKILAVFVTETIKTWRSLGEANHVRLDLHGLKPAPPGGMSKLKKNMGRNLCFC